MTEENMEETTSQKSEEEETSPYEELSETLGEEPLEEEQETSEKPEETSLELEEKNKRLYARMKKAEEEAKRLKRELEERKASSTSPDVFELAKTVSALKEYNDEELEYIQLLARAKNISPVEAAKTKEAKLYIAALREKVEKENKTPEPSTRQAASTADLEKISPMEVKNLPESKQIEWVNLRRKKAGKPPIPK